MALTTIGIQSGMSTLGVIAVIHLQAAYTYQFRWVKAWVSGLSKRAYLRLKYVD